MSAEQQAEDFIPPFPKPHSSKADFLKRFIKGWNSWLHVLFERSYKMKIGHVKLPKSELFMVSEPNAVKKVMVSEYENYPKHHFVDEVLRPLLGESIFTTNGELWQKQRKMIDPAFQHARLQKVFPLMEDAAKEMLSRFTEKSSESDVNIDIEMTHVTADIIFRTILSHPLTADEAEQIFSAFNKFQEQAQRAMILKGYGLPTFFARKKSQKAADGIRPILARIIKKRYDAFQKGEDTENRDILSALMQSRDEKTGEAFTYEELVDHISMLFLAGHETSASALTWSLYLLASCEHIQQKVADEIAEVCGNGEIEFEHIKKLKFTHDVFREALRLYPPVGFFLRESVKDQCLRDREIKKDSMVLIAPWLIQRNSQQWQCPHSFKPERFSDDESKESIKSSYLPFGSGPRICIGKGFANQEATLILASLVKKFRFKNIDGQTPEPVGRVTIRPKEAINLAVEPRN